MNVNKWTIDVEAVIRYCDNLLYSRDIVDI